jgi:hypothetical protein
MALGWIVKAAAVLGAVSLAGFDAGSIGVCRLTGADLANAAARAASAAATRGSGSRATYDTAYDAAVRRVHETDPAASVPPGSFVVGPNGSVRLVVRRTARTYVVSRVDAVRDLAVVEVSGAAPASP